MPYTQEAAIGQALRPLLDNNGFSSVKIIGFEHNWDHAGQYPVSLMNAAGSSFAGVTFHCYGGSVANQDTFHNAFPNKEVYFTECTGSMGSDWWSDIKCAIGAPQHWSRTGLMWNIASDANGGPKFPGTSSCNPTQCRAMVTINTDGSYSFNQEFYALAQASRAIVPKDAGGPIGQRIGVSVGGNLSWALRVNAFVTKRNNSADFNRYSIVVLNWNDSASTSWNPQPVKATIEFRGVQLVFDTLVLGTYSKQLLEFFMADARLICDPAKHVTGNKAATFPLQLLGWDVDAINTVHFSNHAGYRSHGGSKSDRGQLLDIFSVLERNEFAHTDALLTGYVPGAESLSVVADFAAKLKESNPNMVFLIDPVMGDDGKMYVADDVLPVYRDRLLRLATIITPNWFETELLTKVRLISRDSLRSALKILHTDLGVPHVVITSVIVRRGSRLLDEVVQAGLGTTKILATNGATSNNHVPDEFILCVSSSASNDTNTSPTVHALAVPRIKGYFSGVGDIFSALVLAHFEAGPFPPADASAPTTPLSRAASRALHTTHTVLRRTQEHALKVAADESSAYTDDELDTNEPLRRVRRMKTRELRLVQSRDDILACGDGRVEVQEMKLWNGFWED
ncbi:hypothetical protein FRC10_007168 [Ceratobasidium sp. 414]|nr:hypothetical protein FRC10_007168 [Ceratobasidium sp. 414]